jgi:hypothetical protein
MLNYGELIFKFIGLSVMNQGSFWIFSVFSSDLFCLFRLCFKILFLIAGVDLDDVSQETYIIIEKRELCLKTYEPRKMRHESFMGD